MIASFYNLQKSITSIRMLCGTDKQGTNLKGLLTAAKNLGFSAHALKGDKSALNADLHFPFIVHLAIQIVVAAGSTIGGTFEA